jgi:RHS repeat-associated protein
MKLFINTLIVVIIVINNWVGNTEQFNKSFLKFFHNSFRVDRSLSNEVDILFNNNQDINILESSPADLNCNSSSEATYYLGPVIPETVSLVVDEPDDIGRDKDGFKGVITTDYYVGAIFRYSIASDFDGPGDGDVKGWRDQFENNQSSTQLWHWSYNDSLGGGTKPDNGSFCSSINNPLDNKTSAEICSLVCPTCMINVSTDGEDGAAIGCDRNKSVCINGGLEIRAGFFLHVNKIIEEAMGAQYYDIQLIYFGIPKSLPPRSILSNNQPKNASGDSRNCDVSRCDDNRSGVGDPIDVQTGNFDYSYTDLSLQTIAGELSLQRSYASQAADTAIHPTDISPGWTHNQDIRLLFEGDTVWFKGHTLNQYRFDVIGDHLYDPYNGVLAELVYDNGQYLLTTSSQTVYLFDGDGRLLSWTNERGFGFYNTYSGRKLERVTEPLSGRYLQFNYLDGVLQSVTDSAGRQVSYAYDGNGDLAVVTDVLGNTWSYSYNNDHQITAVYAPGIPPEVLLTIAYDDQDRAYEQHNGAGNQLTHIDFNPDGSSTSTDASGNSTNHTPDCRGVITRTDTHAPDSIHGYFIDRGYDHNFNLTSIRGQDDVTATSFKWSSNGVNLLEMTDQASNYTKFTYDTGNHLTHVIVGEYGVNEISGEVHAVDKMWQDFLYNGPLLEASTESSSLGDVTTTYTYTTSADATQPINLLKTITDALDHQTSLTYDSLGQLITVTDAEMNETHFTYNATGQVETITDALGRVVLVEYDPSGTVTRFIENYDPGRLPNEENQFNISTSYGYDLQGRLEEVKNTNNLTTATTVYDDAGRIYQLLDALNNPTTYTYNEDGTLDTVLIALEYLTCYEYDDLGRITGIRDSMGHLVTAYTYNADSTVATEMDVAGLTTSYTYDALHRVIQVSDNAGHVVSTTYDTFGAATSITDALGRVTSFEYSDPGRLTAVVDNYLASPPPDYDVYATNIRTEYTYDILGNLKMIKDANGYDTNYTYTDLYQLENVIDPLGHITSYTYDALGGQKTLTRSDMTVTIFNYDLVNRLIGIDYPGGTDTDVSFTYNSLSQLTGMDDSLGYTGWEYTLLGQPELITDPFNHTVAYDYNTLGNRTHMIYAGRMITYEYNADGLLEEVLDGANSLVSYSYDTADRLELETYTYGLTSSYTYDLSSQLTGITHRLNNRNLAHYAYTYDLVSNIIRTEEDSRYPNYDFMPIINIEANGLKGLDEGYPAPKLDSDGSSRLFWDKVVSVFEGLFVNESVSAINSTAVIPPDQVIDYTYDSLDRLRNASYSNGVNFTYLYDKVGNRTSQTINAATTLYVYDIANRLTSVNGVNYNWNDNGSLMNDGLMDYTYNPAGQLSGINSPNRNFTFQYDGLGNRYIQTFNGQTTIYSLDLASGLTTVLREGTINYLYGRGLIGQERGGELEIALVDRLGSVRQLVIEDQQVTLLKSYDPFGNTIFKQGEGASVVDYTGEQKDESGLVYLRARYYDPEIGRFISADPFLGVLRLPDTQNAYPYSINNPLTQTDHSGMIVDTLLDAAFVAWDIHDINTKIKEGCEVNLGDWAGLGLDVVSMMIPFLPALGGVIFRGLSHTDDIIDAGRLIDKTSGLSGLVKQLPLPGFTDNLDYIKKIPNPNGRNGGPLHKEYIQRTIDQIASNGFSFKKEYHIPTPGGKKSSRYIDVVALDSNKNPFAYYQIGKITNSGRPVLREIEALNDLYCFGEIKSHIFFIPYN